MPLRLYKTDKERIRLTNNYRHNIVFPHPINNQSAITSFCMFGLAPAFMSKCVISESLSIAASIKGVVPLCAMNAINYK